MNLDSVNNARSGPQVNARAARGQIAAQACETCRGRKQKCDEARPKCGFCQRMNLECKYREPQPTKKDKTLVEILDKLDQIKTTIDRISTNCPAFHSDSLRPTSSAHSTQQSFAGTIFALDDNSSFTTSPLAIQDPCDSLRSSQPFYYTSIAHKILLWPAIQRHIQSIPAYHADIKCAEQEGSIFIVQLHKVMMPLPLNDHLPSQPLAGIQSQPGATGGVRVTFPFLTHERIHCLALAYFETFNLLYPFMDRQNFMADILARIYTEGFDDNIESVIALLVFALGELALDGARGLSLDIYQFHQINRQDRYATRPPGLALFNEARRRTGFVLTDSNLENVQIFALTALYYQSCFRHLEFWRLAVYASLACRFLVTCNPIDWSSVKGRLIKRIYWHCAVVESGLHQDLGLPLTGLLGIDELVGLPDHDSGHCSQDETRHRASCGHHYAAHISLQRLYLNIHSTIHESTIPYVNFSDMVPKIGKLQELALQLSHWRSTLSKCIQWTDEDLLKSPFLPENTSLYSQTLDPSLTRHHEPEVAIMYPSDIRCETFHYTFIYDIQVALLRTRYCYANYLIHRPYIFKALHFPDQVTREDAQGVAECLRACIKWPLIFSPVSRFKRLVPYLFSWSQIFMSVLMVLHMTKNSPTLQKIRFQLCGERFEEDILESVQLMIEWIRDLRGCDPIASWCYEIIQPIYHLEP